MSDQRKQSMFLIAYKGRGTADQVYDILRDLEKQKLKKVDIKTAAVVTRKDNGKLKLKHKRRLTVWKGTLSGGVIALLLVGTGGGAVVGGAVIGALLGSTRSGQRREVKRLLDDELGQNDSALAILISDADWAAVDEATSQFNGREISVELTPDAEKQLKAIASDETVAAAVADEVESEDDADVEEVEDTA